MTKIRMCGCEDIKDHFFIEIVERYYSGIKNTSSFYIRCLNCGVETNGTYSKREEAIKVWNEMGDQSVSGNQYLLFDGE